jgi:hypothetical protein
MTKEDKRFLRLVALAALFVVVAALVGSFIRPSGIYPKVPNPEPAVATTPDPRLELAGIQKSSAYVAAKESCRTPGHGKVAYCWFEGWQYAKKTICIDSSISGAPLSALASHYNGVGGLRIMVKGKVGTCAADGYPASQRVSFLSMSKNGASRYGYRVCGLTSPANYGILKSVSISIYVTGTKTTPCGGGVEWGDVFEHEFGHTLGLSHNQPASTSVMRDSNGHGLDSHDRSELNILYGGKRS